MLRGLFKNYKQPLLYSFRANTTNRDKLVYLIKSTMRSLINIRFDVVATVCDQGATNVSAINYLINERRCKFIALNKESRNSTFDIDDHEIIPLYDPPHLIKCIRNNFLNKDLRCKIKGTEVTAKWDHIIKLYNCDPPFEGLRLVPKLTDRHIIPHKIYKMKVKCATQVLSSTVALHMGMMTKCGSLPEECLETAKIIAFFDKLFDSFNGSYKHHQEKCAKPLLGPVTKHSIHHEVWTEAKPILNSMNYAKNDFNAAYVTDRPETSAITAPDVAITAPDVAITAPDVAITAPDVAITVPDFAITAPDVAITTPDVHLLYSPPDPAAETTISKTTTSLLSPEVIKFPKAPLRKQTGRGRQGKSRIYTDTPERERLELIEEEIRKKRA